MFHWYGLIVGVAVVVGWSVAARIYVSRGGMMRLFEQSAMWILVGGLIGARLYHVVDYFEYYSAHLTEIPAVWNGGLAIWGGLIGGTLAYRCFCRTDWALLAAIVVGVPLAQAIGRVGNYVNGEFYERIFGLEWWLLEAILDLCLFGLLYWLMNVRKVDNISVVSAYLLGYGTIRLVLEWWRVDRAEIYGIPVAVLFAILSIGVGWALRARRSLYLLPGAHV